MLGVLEDSGKTGVLSFGRGGCIGCIWGSQVSSCYKVCCL